MHEWIKSHPAAITVCDKDGIVLSMNDKAIQTFAKYGGEALIGSSLYDCHPPYACAKIREMLASGIGNSYSIEKNGIKKIIHQHPWFVDGAVAGLVEISIEVPIDMQHHVRS